MNEGKISRRDFLRSAAIVGAGLATMLASCQPKVVEVEKVVTKEVEKEKIVTQVVKETVLVEGKEKEVTRIVEKVVTVAPPPAAKPAPAEEITLLYTNWYGDADTYKKEVGKPFEEMHPGVKVKAEIFPSRQYWPKVNTQLAAGAEGLNVFGCAVDRAWPFAQRALILNLQPLFDRDGMKEEDYYEGSLLGLRYRDALKGDLYALPLRFVYYLMFYNKTIFDEAGVDYPDEDWTYDDLLEAGKHLNKDTTGDGEIDQWAIRTPTRYAVAHPIFLANGGRFFDENFKCVLADDPVNLESLQWMVDLVHKHKVAPGLEIYAAMGDPFGSGMMATMFNGCWNLEPYQEIEKFEWEIAFTPKGTVQRSIYSGPDAAAIPAAGKHIDLCWELLKFTISPEINMKGMPMGSMTPIKGEKWRKMLRDLHPKPESIDVFLDSAALANYPLWSTPGFSEWIGAWSSEHELAMLGQKSPEQALKDASVAIDEIVTAALEL